MSTPPNLRVYTLSVDNLRVYTLSVDNLRVYTLSVDTSNLRVYTLSVDASQFTAGLEKTRIFYIKKNNPLDFLIKPGFIEFFSFFRVFGFLEKKIILRFKEDTHVIMCPYNANNSQFVI